MFRPDRSPDRPVRHLEWRVRIFGAAALLAAVGFYFDASWVIWVAMGLLVVGLLMRFVPREGDVEEPDAGEGSGT